MIVQNNCIISKGRGINRALTPPCYRPLYAHCMVKINAGLPILVHEEDFLNYLVDGYGHKLQKDMCACCELKEEAYRRKIIQYVNSSIIHFDVPVPLDLCCFYYKVS